MFRGVYTHPLKGCPEVWICDERKKREGEKKEERKRRRTDMLIYVP